MHILGIANGTPEGNSEILLKSALTAAQNADSSITCSWIHIPSVSIPNNPPPLEGTMDISGSTVSTMFSGSRVDGSSPDDRRALLDHILDADAYIIATPVYCHSPAGFLKGVLDRIMGPFTDATHAQLVSDMKKRGDPAAVGMAVDERILKKRVAGLICVGGSTTPDQFSLALPMLHLLIYPLHVKVVDQVIFPGCGVAGSVLTTNNGAAVDRAAEVGKHVAQEMGKAFDDAVYHGPRSKTSCPYCYLDKIDLLYDENKMQCVCCGAQGRMTVGSDGIIVPLWDGNCGICSITWAGKVRHGEDIRAAGRRQMAEVGACVDFESQRQKWLDVDFPVAKLPSQERSKSSWKL